MHSGKCDLQPVVRITLKSSQLFTCICSIGQESWEYKEVSKEGVAAKIIKNLYFSLLLHFHSVLLFLSTLLSFIFCYFFRYFFFVYVIFVSSFLHILFIQLYSLALLDCFLNLMCITFNQAFIPGSCTMFGSVFCFPLFHFLVNLFTYNCSNLLFIFII